MGFGVRRIRPIYVSTISTYRAVAVWQRRNGSHHRRLNVKCEDLTRLLTSIQRQHKKSGQGSLITAMATRPRDCFAARRAAQPAISKNRPRLYVAWRLVRVPQLSG
jgi:hypothetical protein